MVYYQLDHLGTPIAEHNAKGEAVWTVEYEAWGRIRNETVSDGLKADIPFRFQGQYYDEESGLHYNRFVITTKRMLDEIERTGDLTTRDLLRKSWSI
ncbi:MULTISPECIES: RHS repeat domain-containing protein [Neisseria]|uniref:RHS repeat domain-containing protein n=1 Tax=Neisseria TaxID=482 RepID=UPI000B2F3A04|nr:MULTISPECIES: RHS domain-containing protein [Neisseria]